MLNYVLKRINGNADLRNSWVDFTIQLYLIVDNFRFLKPGKLTYNMFYKLKTIEH